MQGSYLLFQVGLPLPKEMKLEPLPQRFQEQLQWQEKSVPQCRWLGGPKGERRAVLHLQEELEDHGEPLSLPFPVLQGLGGGERPLHLLQDHGEVAVCEGEVWDRSLLRVGGLILGTTGPGYLAPPFSQPLPMPNILGFLAFVYQATLYVYRKIRIRIFNPPKSQNL